MSSAYTPETLPDDLPLVVGGARVVRLNLLDQNDEPEDLSGASLPQVDIAEAAGETAIISKSGGEVTIEPGGDTGVLEFTLSDVDTALLSVGSYVAQGKVTIGGDIYVTGNFYVKVTGKVVG